MDALGLAVIVDGWSYHPTRDDFNGYQRSKGVEITRDVGDGWAGSLSYVTMRNSIRQDTQYVSFGGRYRYEVLDGVTVGGLVGAAWLDYGRPSKNWRGLVPALAPEACVWRLCAEATYIPAFEGVAPAVYWQAKLRVF